MDNKFMNLKKEYRDFVKKSAQMVKKINIDDELTKEKCTDIFKLYQEIYDMIETSTNLNINDINHILTNYSRDDTDVDTLKKFIKIKNLYVVKKIIKSSLWEPYVEKICNEIDLGDSELNNKKTTHIVSKSIYRLLRESIEQFRGCWEIAELKDNKVKKLDIIEPEHYEYLVTYIKNKINDDCAKQNLQNQNLQNQNSKNKSAKPKPVKPKPNTVKTKTNSKKTNP